MKAILEYLISLANDQPIAKINPECPFEAYWFRNRADTQGFKNWRLKYDDTYSSGKYKTMSHEVSSNSQNRNM